MSNTHSSFYIHVAFSTKYRLRTLDSAWRDRLHAYVGGAVRNAGGASIEVGGVEDHVHVLMRLRASHRASDVLRNVKTTSSKWIHSDVGLAAFAWQDGYGAFSVSRSRVDAVQRYIRRQEEHHRTQSFEQEYVTLLERNGVEYDPAYLW